MDCQTALQVLDCVSVDGGSDVPPSDLAAAEGHLINCSRCAVIVRSRRRLDRRIGRMLRAVDVPRDAQHRLLEKIAGLEFAEPVSEPNGQSVVTDSRSTAPVPDPASAEVLRVPISDERPEVHSPERRRFLRGLVSATACLLVAGIGFYGAVWLLTPRWSVADIRDQLAKLDVDAISALPNFHGASVASTLPVDAAWQNVAWGGGRLAKSLPGTSGRRTIAVYGFRVRDGRGGWMSGFLAVAPRNVVRNPPTESSIAYAPNPEYVSARIGESVSVAWTSDRVVCVCLVQGGADSLATLQGLLSAPAA